LNTLLRGAMPGEVDLAYQVAMGSWVAFAIVGVAFVACGVLCEVALPHLRRLFLVTPGVRSSHVRATPQGGGLIVAPTALAIAWAMPLALGWRPQHFDSSLLVALLALTALGCWDDLRGLSARFRLLIQAGAVSLILATAPVGQLPIVAWLPPVLAFACLLVGVLWFVNLTNFMDGIDLISVTQFVPALLTIALLEALGHQASDLSLITPLCLSFVGALLGFAPLNRPPARLFLGDSGSLPLGLLGAAGALLVAGRHGVIVAALPFLYYCADATLTLARRALAGERVWEAHRQHFYQLALQRGLTVPRIILRIGACNALLCVVSLIVVNASPAAHYAALALGILVVGLLLRNLSRGGG
jgi:UDP-N-acetylmuramyl pentapeptide phosphotransferase/UDP-N-acetylglucosamine-1-phosphate transferase